MLVNAAAGAVGSVVGQIAKLEVHCLPLIAIIYSKPTVCTGHATVNTATSSGLREVSLVDLI